jgi:carbon monoxide dehydrogenase subunit G
MAIKLEVEETFAAPREKVWAALTDVDRMGAWMRGLVRIERLGGPAFGKGTRFREVRKMFGKEAAEVFEVIEVDPPRSFTLHVDGREGSSKRGDYRFRHELEPAGAGTRLRLSGEISGMGWFFTLLGGLFAGAFRRACRKDLAALKAHIEKNGAATS